MALRMGVPSLLLLAALAPPEALAHDDPVAAQAAEGPADYAEADPSLEPMINSDWGAFVLSLKKQPERFRGFMDSIRKQEPWLLDQALLHKLPAVDGHAVLSSPADREALIRKNIVSRELVEQALGNVQGAARWEELSPGAIGLYLSHSIAWHYIVRERLDFGIIFEDDLRYFSGEFKTVVQKFMRSKPKPNFDIAYLQHCMHSAQWSRGSAQAPKEASKAREIMDDDDEIVACTAAYIVSRRAATQLLKKAFPIEVQLDRALSPKVSNATLGLRRLVFEPALAQVGEASFSSTVQTNGWTWWSKFRCTSVLGRFFPC